MSNCSPEVALFNDAIQLDTSLTTIWKQRQRARLKQPNTEMTANGVPLWLRSYTPGDLITRSDRDVHETLQIATAHFNVLRELGANVVSFALEARDDLRPAAKVRRKSTVVAYAATYFVARSTALEDLERGALSRKDIRRSVVQPVHTYLDWCRDTNQPQMLADIYGADQYSWEPESGTIFLHDLDPLLVGIEHMEPYEIQELYDWTTAIAR